MNEGDTHLEVRPKDALLVVDVQKDFLPGGNLAVPNGGAVVPRLNQYIERFNRRNLCIVATRDWHPTDHCSFAARGGPWPPHCIAGTEGAQFADDLELPEQALVISKATQTEKDAYSGFEDTELGVKLRDMGVKRVFVGGLATDYCVRNTVLDAIKLGFEAIVLEDAIRAVNADPEDGAKAEAEMKHAGAQFITLDVLQ
jgi:nicotinamidase/pyrazinamidase